MPKLSQNLFEYDRCYNGAVLGTPDGRHWIAHARVSAVERVIPKRTENEDE